MFQTRYKKLNARQRQAVDTLEGPVMVIAGPGSGKTELLGLRAANLLLKTDVNPEEILCLTFTDAAAHNMRERLASIIGPEAYRVAVHTFHDFGGEIINRYPEFFYDGAVFAPADELTKISVLETLLEALPYDSPLRKIHPEQGYTFLSDVQKHLENLKTGGLTPEDLSALLVENRRFETMADPLLSDFFAGRMSKAHLEGLDDLTASLRALPSVADRPLSLTTYATQQELIVKSLQEVQRQAFPVEGNPTTKPLTAWRNRFLKKNDANRWVLQGTYYTRHHQDLAEVYAAYQKELSRRGLYDFSDMILVTARTLETQNSLRFELQEKYRYVMVDEFQDTNGAQLRLLENLLNHPAQSESPNILVVGDDDQAIYKFQGASLEHLMNFERRFQGVKQVVLTENYRSGQAILDYARWVIKHFEDRLENQYAEIVKELQAAGPYAAAGEIYCQSYDTPEAEACAVASQVAALRKAYPEQTVAVIARTHRELEGVAAELTLAGVEMSCERHQDVLAGGVLREILTVAQFAHSILHHRLPAADELLPSILSYEFWGWEREWVWEISLSAHAERITWLEAMRRSPHQKVRKLARFLIALGAEARTKTAEEIVDYITGSSSIAGVNFKSPLRDFYFSAAKLTSRHGAYLEYLGQIRKFFTALREFRPTQTLRMDDMMEFLQLHETHRLPLYADQKIGVKGNPVTLLTAHKAKGQEFDNVVIINCSENGWMKRRGKRNLPLPVNLPLSAEADGEDDFTRLFFVAITRAKRRLLLTFFTQNKEQRAESPLRFLDHRFDTPPQSWTTPLVLPVAEDLLHQETLRKFQLHSARETELLESVVENYRLSATHLNSFLNVARGGPQAFLENHLLHFPQAMTSQLAYGNAVHAAFTSFYREFRIAGQLPSAARFLEIFEHNLKLQNLNEKDFQDCLARGKKELGKYYASQKSVFDCDDRLDVDFPAGAVKVGSAPITGKIDRMSVDPAARTLQVYDYKTGGVFNRWNPAKAYEKIKALTYANQLLFYKILVENSRSFAGFKVTAGGIDFVTPLGDQMVCLQREFSAEEVETMKRLIEIVYNKIVSLDFPSVADYSPDIKGMQAFCADLLAGKV